MHEKQPEVKQRRQRNQLNTEPLLNQKGKGGLKFSQVLISTGKNLKFENIWIETDKMCYQHDLSRDV